MFDEEEDDIHSLLASYRMLLASVQRVQGLQMFVMIADIFCKLVIAATAIPLAVEFWRGLVAK